MEIEPISGQKSKYVCQKNEIKVTYLVLGIPEQRYLLDCLTYSVLDIRRQQDLLLKNTKVRRLLRLHHLLGNKEQLQKWQRFISPSSAFSFGML